MAESMQNIQKLKRRSFNRLITLSPAALLFGCGGGTSAREDQIPSLNDQVACIATPSQTAGPFFLDEDLNRRDIRIDSKTGVVSEGLPLKIAIQIAGLIGNDCEVINAAKVDIWHCNVSGAYSGVRDFNDSFDTTGQNFLRGYQMTSSQGIVNFETIIPGWYSGRSVHIHFKVRPLEGFFAGQDFTSQLYFDDTLIKEIYKQPPYSTRGEPNTFNSRDGIFRRNGEDLVLNLTQDNEGYSTEFTVGLRK